MTVKKTQLGSGDFARRLRFEKSGNLSATDVQEAIEELDTEKQGLDATLTSLAALGTAADRYAYTTGVDTWAEGTITAAGRALLDDADAAAQQATLGLVIGTDVQAFDATLASLAGLGTTADRFAYTTALDTWAEATITAAGRALIDDASAADQRVTLGVQIGVDVQAFDAQLADLAGLTPTKGNVVVGDGSNFVSIGVGADEQVLTADAAQSTGIKWAAAPGGSVFTTIDCPNGTDPVADSGTDTLQLLEGEGMQITGDSTADSVTFALHPDTLSLLRLQSLYIADLQGDRLNMIDGIADPFDDETDVDTATSTNESYDAANDLYEPTAAADAVISLGALTKLADATNDVNAWFDGTTDQASANSTGKVTSIDMFLGVTFSGPTRIAKMEIHGSNDIGYVDNINPSMTVRLYVKDGSAPSSSSDGTELGSINFTDTTNESSARTVTASDTETHYDHVWARISHDGAANTMRVAEVIFYTPAVNNMDLRSNAFAADAAPSTGRLAFQIRPIDTSVLNTDFRGHVSRDGGTTYAQATLALRETLADGTQLVEDASIDISGQPSGTSMKWRAETLNNKQIEVHGAVLQWD